MDLFGAGTLSASGVGQFIQKWSSVTSNALAGISAADSKEASDSASDLSSDVVLKETLLASKSALLSAWSRPDRVAVVGCHLPKIFYLIFFICVCVCFFFLSSIPFHFFFFVKFEL